MNASWALQQSVFAVLSSDGGVQEALGDPPRIFDAPPREAAFPYCVIGDDTMSDWSTATETGSEHALALHVWSRAGGRKEAKLAADAVRAALDGADFDVAGQTLIALRHLSTETIADGESVHAVVRFKAVMEEM